MGGTYGGRKIDGTHVFTGERSVMGYRINKLASSLTDPANREAFLADEDAYMDGFGFSATEKDLVRARDWDGIVEAGGNIYVILKIAATVGSNLLAMGAQMRGETVADLLGGLPGTKATPRSD